jgi:lipopolysaccharide transport system permease protein
MRRAPLCTSPLCLVDSLWRHRGLLWQLTKREIVGRYRGSLLGIAWSLLNPLLMLLVYTIVFGVVFKARWGLPGGESRVDFAIVLFAGLIVFGIFSECVTRAPGLIVAQPNLVKKVVFPLEVMPFTLLASALFHAGVSLVVLLLALAFSRGGVSWSALALPAVVLPLCMLCIGIAYFLSAIGVYLRDVGQIVGLLTSALMFLSPLFFPLSAVPGRLRAALMFNPLTLPIEQTRQVLLLGSAPDWLALLAYAAVAGAVLWFGFWWFQRTRRGFADVL